MSDAPTWTEVFSLALNVLQVIALAWITSRGRRVRSTDEPQHLE